MRRDSTGEREGGVEKIRYVTGIQQQETCSGKGSQSQENDTPKTHQSINGTENSNAVGSNHLIAIRQTVFRHKVPLKIT